MPIAEIPVEIAWGYGHGSPGANIWHARSGTFGDGFAEACAEILDFYDTIKSLYNTTCTIKFLGEVHGVGADTGSTGSEDPWTVTGTDPGSVAPPSLQMLCSWRAVTGGRRGRGRTFIGPLAASAVESNGTPLEASRTLLLGAANDLITDMSTFTDGAIGIYSRTDGLFRDFATVTVPNDFAILRSRRD